MKQWLLLVGSTLLGLLIAFIDSRPSWDDTAITVGMLLIGGGIIGLLLAMAGHLVPDLWRDAAGGAMERLGRFGPYEDYDAAYKGIQGLASSPSDAATALQSADERRKQGLALLSEGRFSEAIVAAEDAEKDKDEGHFAALADEPGLDDVINVTDQVRRVDVANPAAYVAFGYCH